MINCTSLKSQTFYSSKTSFKKIRQPIDGQKILANYVFGKELVFRTYIELLRLDNKKTKILSFGGGQKI